MIQDFKGNTNKCQTLAGRILTLKGPLQRLQSNPKMGSGKTRTSLRNLMAVLSRAVHLINEFGNENWLQKVINEGTAKEAFDQVLPCAGALYCCPVLLPCAGALYLVPCRCCLC